MLNLVNTTQNRRYVLGFDDHQDKGRRRRRCIEGLQG